MEPPSTRPKLYKQSVVLSPSLGGSSASHLAENDTEWKHFFRLSNPLAREALSEFFGTFLLIVIGNGIVANIVLNRVGVLGNLMGPLGWGCTIAIVVMVSGGISGAHVNPALTLALATIGKCRWSRVLPYFAAQYLGAFVASCVLFGIYKDALDNFDGGVREVWDSANATGHIFATYPQTFVTITTCFFDQIVSTCMLVVAVCAMIDQRNMKIPVFMQPVIICFAIASVIIAFSYNCQAAINPARELGCRIFIAMAGWGKEAFSYRNYNWFWVPVVSPHLGGILGAWIYTLAIELHWPTTVLPPIPLDDFKLPWKPTHINSVFDSDTVETTGETPSALCRQSQEPNSQTC